ncbi:MAG TPA: hypothetical protein VIF62_12460, partial [Labilithrix sp.]
MSSEETWLNTPPVAEKRSHVERSWPWKSFFHWSIGSQVNRMSKQPCEMHASTPLRHALSPHAYVAGSAVDC